MSEDGVADDERGRQEGQEERRIEDVVRVMNYDLLGLEFWYLDGCI